LNERQNQYRFSAFISPLNLPQASQAAPNERDFPVRP
jgi:hypothetical protein